MLLCWCQIVTSHEVAERIKELGYRVRVARTRRRLRMAELAEKAGINRNTLNALELGKPGVALRRPARVRQSKKSKSEYDF